MGEGDLPKALDQVNGKFLVRYELGLFGLPFPPPYSPHITATLFIALVKRAISIYLEKEARVKDEGECHPSQQQFLFPPSPMCGN